MSTRTSCPQCGRAAGEGLGHPDHTCRDVRAGWYCAARGLRIDPARLVAPVVEPRPWEHTPEVEAAALAERAAEAAYDSAARDWQAAHMAVVAARRSRRTVFGVQGGLVPDRLGDAEEAARKRRDAAGDELSQARLRTQRALTEARRRHPVAEAA